MDYTLLQLFYPVYRQFLPKICRQSFLFESNCPLFPCHMRACPSDKGDNRSACGDFPCWDMAAINQYLSSLLSPLPPPPFCTLPHYTRGLCKEDSVYISLVFHFKAAMITVTLFLPSLYKMFSGWIFSPALNAYLLCIIVRCFFLLYFSITITSVHKKKDQSMILFSQIKK